ncbi:MAG: hypothetical protein ACLFV2_09535 [Desulfurivibrionaceae bacterium]
MKHKGDYHMEDKGKTRSPEEMKEIFEALADQVNKGEITVGENTVEVAGSYFLRSRARVKKGSLEYQISFEADLPGGRHEEGRPDEKKQESLKGNPSGKKERERIKKEMKPLWKEIVTRIEAGESPDQKVSQQMMKLCTDYDNWVEENCKEDWNNCKLKLERCLEAAGNGVHDEAGRLMTEVKGLVKDCHDKYK